MYKRYLTINLIVRLNQIEVRRDKFIGRDEYDEHFPEDMILMSNIIRDGFPEAKITWAFSWGALFDQTEKYQQIRQTVLNFQTLYGDDITFIPGGYFANRYNTREEINQDLHDALQAIEKWTGKRPNTIIAGFLAADNIAYAREHEGILGVQGTIWSQYSVDNQDGDGSVAYPYYPSREHFCKMAQNEADRIDCVNFDGWTVDFFNGRLNKGRGSRNNSRLGVGPIETLGNLGADLGLREMMATTEAHFETSASSNPFNWVTVNIETSLLHHIPHLNEITNWLKWMHARWPDVVCPTLSEFCFDFRSEFPNNDTLKYKLIQNGNAIGASRIGEKIVWYMNKEFRLGLISNQRKVTKVFDYTPYSPHYAEPQGLDERNWSLLGTINQKRTRRQDRPVKLAKWDLWKEIKKDLIRIYNLKDIYP